MVRNDCMMMNGKTGTTGSNSTAAGTFEGAEGPDNKSTTGTGTVAHFSAENMTHLCTLFKLN
ncbi:MAG: hypothetical protein ORN49_14110 [Rhodobacteraceae bacterium]|nr:hypothetical protein [Paracoccaceae bacterium]